MHPQVFQTCTLHAERCWKRVKLIRSSVMSGIMAHLMLDLEYDEELVLSFFSQIHGIELAKSTIIDLLRNRITNDSVLGRDERWAERVLVIARAWNAYVTDEKLKHLKTPPLDYDFLHARKAKINF